MRTDRAAFPAVAAVAAAWLAAGYTAPAAAQAVRIPRTTITVTAPPGFKVARTFSGLENEETGSKITLVENPPEAHAELLAVFASPRTTANRYASQGIRIMRIEQVTTDEGPIPLAIGGKAEDGKEVVTYISTLGGPATNTMAVLATFSIAPSDTLTRADVEAVLRSIKLTRLLTTDQKVERLTFDFRAAAPFEVTSVEASSVLLTSTDKADTASATPAIVINRALTRSSPREVAQLSETLIRSTAGFRDAQVSEQAAAPFAGGDGYLMAAAAGGLSMRQYVRVLPGGRYIRLAARGGAAQLERVRAAVNEIASSVALEE